MPIDDFESRIDSAFATDRPASPRQVDPFESKINSVFGQNTERHAMLRNLAVGQAATSALQDQALPYAQGGRWLTAPPDIQQEATDFAQRRAIANRPDLLSEFKQRAGIPEDVGVAQGYQDYARKSQDYATLVARMLLQGEQFPNEYEVLESLPDEDRPMFRQILDEMSASFPKDRRTVTETIGERLTRGARRVGENVYDTGAELYDRAARPVRGFMGGGAGIERLRDVRDTQALRREVDPASGGGSLVERGLYGAVENVPQLAGYAGAQIAGGPAGVALFGMSQTYPERKREYMRAGFSENAADIGAAATAAVESVIETIISPTRLVGLEGPVRAAKQGAMSAIRAAILDYAKRGGGELSEEILQDVSRIGTEAALQILEPHVTPDIRGEIERAIAQLPETAITVGALAAPGTAAQGARAVANRNDPRLELTKQRLLTSNDATRRFVELDPQAAKRIADNPRPSRADIESSGLPRQVWSQSERAALSARLNRVFQEEASNADQRGDGNDGDGRIEIAERTEAGEGQRGGQPVRVESAGFAEAEQAPSAETDGDALRREERPGQPNGEPKAGAGGIGVRDGQRFDNDATTGAPPGETIDPAERRIVQRHDAEGDERQGQKAPQPQGQVVLDQPQPKTGASLEEEGQKERQAEELLTEPAVQAQRPEAVAPDTPEDVAAPEIQNPASMVSKSGRRLSPMPDKPMTERTAGRRIRESDEWLIKEAIAEARHRSDRFNERMFVGELPIQKHGLPQASRDAAHEYLFGRQDVRLDRNLKPEDTAAAEADLNAESARFMKKYTGRLFSTPIDPEIVADAGRVVGKAIKVGALKFRDFIRRLASQIGKARVSKSAAVWREAWDARAATDKRLDYSSDVDEILKSSDAADEIGSSGLANPAKDSGARNVVEAVRLTTRDLSGKPTPLSDKDVQAKADTIGNDDIRKKVFEVAERDGQLSDVETVAAKRIVAAEAMKAASTGDRDALVRAANLIHAYTKTGTEQARAFRQRREFGGAQQEKSKLALAEALLTPRTPNPTKEQRAAWVDRVPAVIEKLKASGIDVSNIDGIAKDKYKSAEMLRQIYAAQSRPRDILYEYWLNAILYNPITLIRNFFGIGYAGWHMMVERPLEAMLNSALGVKGGPQAGEIRHMLAGIMPGLSLGARNFVATWKTEIPQFEQHWRIEDHKVSIPGKLGRAIRVPTRLMAATDDFVKSLIGYADVGAQAYRIAKSEKLSGKEMQKRISDLVLDIESDAWVAAKETSRKASFQGELGSFGQAAIAFRRKFTPTYYVVPFITTPTNMFRIATQRTVAGSLELPFAIYKAAKSNDYSHVTEVMARQVLAWAITLAIASMLDDEEPEITGAIDAMSKGKRSLSLRGIPLRSIKIAGKWYSYANIEPFDTVLSLTVDWVNAVKSGDAARISRAPFETLSSQLRGKTFLSGVSDVLDALDATQGEEKAARIASSFVASWVPAFVRHAGRAVDEVQEQQRTWGNGWEWGEMLAFRTAQRVGVPGEPMYDVWGRPYDTPRSPVPHTDFLWRMMSPITYKTPDIAPGDKILMEWNRANPDKEKYPSEVPTHYESDGTKKHLNREQYAAYARQAGEVARAAIAATKIDSGAENVTMVESLLERARAETKKLLIPQWDSGSAGTVAVDELADRVLLGYKGTLAKAATAPEPKFGSGKKPSAVREAIEEWKKDRDRANEILDRMGVSRQELWQILDKTTDFKPDTMRERVGRYRRSAS